MKYFVPIFLLILIVNVTSLAQPYPEHNVYDTDLLPPSFFKANRERLIKTLGDSAVVVMYSAGEHKRNNDVDYVYRQDDDFYYLTGFNEPNSILILSSVGFESPDRGIVHEALLVDQHDPFNENVVGKKLGPEGAMEILDFEYALANDDLSAILPEALINAKGIYLLAEPEESKDPLKMLINEIKSAVEPFKQTKFIGSPKPTLKTMRDVKQPEELAMMRKALALTIQGQLSMMRSCKPEMFEYQLQSAFEFAITNGGGERIAYPCIIGSGENSVILHYLTNRKQMKSGEVVVMDCGGEYHNYASDLTRTIPVSGNFSKEQREIYDIVLLAQEEAIKTMKPGIKYYNEPTHKAQEVIRDGLLRLGIIKDSLDWRLFYPHDLGHPIGYSAHDISVDNYLRPNQVWTVEPGIYIPANAKGVDPKYYNIGIRIEDEVLITETGITVLSSDLPKMAEEVERMMGGK